MSALAGMIDGRCDCAKCVERTENVYRMVGSCSNCHAGPFLILYRAGDPVSDQDCPACENYWTVRRYEQRLATPDEIPALTRDRVQAVTPRDPQEASTDG